MNERPERLRIVAQWVARAKEDIDVAESLLAVEPYPAATICFHAQQAVEKSFKALLTLHSIAFPKTHDLAELAALLPPEVKLPAGPSEIGLLKRYAVETRYPGDWDPITREDCDEALRLATAIAGAIRTHLPEHS